MHIFRFLQKYLIGFNPRLWLGHSRTFTDLSISHTCCVCVGPLSCWKVNLLPSIRFGMLWNVFSLRLSQYFGALSFSSTLTFPSVPASEKQLHSILYFWDGTLHVMRSAWFPSNMMLGIEVHQTREYYFSQSEGPLGDFLQILSLFSCVYTEERIESCQTAIKHRSIECCSGVCPSVDFSYLHI